MTNKISLNAHLLLSSQGTRHGINLPSQTAHLDPCDIENLFHVGIPSSIETKWQSASGGVSRDLQQATLAALGESIERYTTASSQIPLRNRGTIEKSKLLLPEEFCLFTPGQRANKEFPFENIYTDNCLYSNVFDIQNNDEFWAPQPLISLRDDFATGVPTSSGLAADPDPIKALLRAVQEVIERDALMASWLHSLSGRAVRIPKHYRDEVSQKAGEVYAFDLTPRYCPFPVIAVAGGVPKSGKFRYSLGVACREDFKSAIDRAYLEWSQGVFFAGIYPEYVDTVDIAENININSFDEHAMYYTINPEKWEQIPLIKNRNRYYEPTIGKKMDPKDALRQIIKSLKKNNISMYYKPLTTIDSVLSGVHVMRALSPDMIPIYTHQEWPFIGGNTSDIHRRYKWAPKKTTFPNPLPHPLG